ncbi:MAG: UDP-3-O-acyl-N-acetylglucosamine deacetylase [Gammaproteobacteria bacterium WSBS_2016_MAG_OTU1]
MNANQQTIARPFGFSGIALHSGSAAHVLLSPLPENSGVVFCRSDMGKCIRASSDNVRDTRLATTLGDDSCTVGTVEHLLSALAALGVDNIKVEVDEPELPIVDGSAAPWMLFLTDACGLTTQNAPKKIMRVRKKVTATINGGHAYFLPPSGEAATYTVGIDFPHAVVRRTGDKYSHVLEAADYEENISRARTFCYVNDVESMRRNHRALGGSLRNAVVFDDTTVLNAEGLRYPDEFVRHKVLDAIGDCYINGNLIWGDYHAECPGHALNHALVTALTADEDAWEWV